MDMAHTTEVVAILIYLLILAKNWFPWQHPLDPYNQKCLLWIARPRKPPVISNHILAISRTNEFICIYSNISPKIGCHGNAPLYKGVSQMNFPTAQTLCQNQTLYGLTHTTEVVAIL